MEDGIRSLPSTPGVRGCTKLRCGVQQACAACNDAGSGTGSTPPPGRGAEGVSLATLKQSDGRHSAVLCSLESLLGSKGQMVQQGLAEMPNGSAFIPSIFRARQGAACEEAGPSNTEDIVEILD